MPFYLLLLLILILLLLLLIIIIMIIIIMIIIILYGLCAQESSDTAIKIITSEGYGEPYSKFSDPKERSTLHRSFKPSEHTTGKD